jgi:hypothetical protein
MAKNQRRDIQAIRWQTFGFVLFAVTAVAGMTLGYVLQRKAHQRLGEQVVRLERRAQDLRTALQQQRILQARLISPAQLRLRINELGLGLTNVSPSQRLFVNLALDSAMPAANGASAAPLAVDRRETLRVTPTFAAASAR